MQQLQSPSQNSKLHRPRQRFRRKKVSLRTVALLTLTLSRCKCQRLPWSNIQRACTRCGSRAQLMTWTGCCSSSGCNGACTRSSMLLCTPFPLSPTTVPIMAWRGAVAHSPQLPLLRMWQRLVQAAGRLSCSVEVDGGLAGTCAFALRHSLCRGDSF